MSLRLANAATRQPTQLAASQLLALVDMDDEQQVAVLLADMRALVSRGHTRGDTRLSRCEGRVYDHDVPEVLAVTPLEQVLRSCLEALEAEHLESEGAGEPIGHVERGADRQRVLDLLP
jgi:hypothetical protein